MNILVAKFLYMFMIISIGIFFEEDCWVQGYDIFEAFDVIVKLSSRNILPINTPVRSIWECFLNFGQYLTEDFQIFGDLISLNVSFL